MGTPIKSIHDTPTVPTVPIKNEKEIDVTMEIEEHPNAKTYLSNKRYEPKIKDHTAIITAKTCFRKYFYQIVLGYTPKEEAIYFAWGSAYHKFRNILTLNYGYGDSEPFPFNEAKAQLAFVEAAQAGIKYWQLHGRDQAVGSKYEFMTTERLLKSFKKAYEHWTLERKQGRIKVLATEQPFNVQLSDGSYTSGRADEIVKWNGKVWGRDFKTTSKDSAFFARSLTPNDQFTRYTYAEGKLAGTTIQGQIIECLFNAKSTKKDTKGPEIVTHLASRTPTEIDDWERDNIVFNKLLDVCRETDTYPMCEVACPFCPYHSVCQKTTEGGKLAKLNAEFIIRPWDNTRIGID